MKSSIKKISKKGNKLPGFVGGIDKYGVYDPYKLNETPSLISKKPVSLLSSAGQMGLGKKTPSEFNKVGIMTNAIGGADLAKTGSDMLTGGAGVESGLTTAAADGASAGAGVSPAAIAGLGTLAGSTIEGFGNGDATASATKVGKTLSKAGQFASAGAAFGPWAAAGLGVAGGIIGLIGANKDAAAQVYEEKTEAINKSTNLNEGVDASIRDKYNTRNLKNNRMPGLKKGVASFDPNTGSAMAPNAKVASEEVIMDAASGDLSVVPGKYNPTNPDTVFAMLNKKDSVFSKEIVPQGGVSSHADIMTRAAKAQTASDLLLHPKNGQRSSSEIEKRTAELNKKNIAKQAELLNKDNYMRNGSSIQPDKSMLPGYVLGLASDLEDQVKSNTVPNMTVPKDGEDYIEINVPIKKGQTMAKQSIALLNQEAKRKYGVDYNFGTQGGSADEALAGYMVSQVPGYHVGQTIGHAPGTYKVRIPAAMANKYLATGKQPDPAVIADDKKVQVEPVIKDAVKPVDTGAITPEQAKQRSIGSKIGGGNLGSLGNMAAFAPAINNLLVGPAEKESPVYERFVSTKQRFNTAEALRNATEQRKINAFNSRSLNGSTGASMATRYSSAAINQISDIHAKADIANNSYKDKESAIINQGIQSNAAETRRVNLVNSRNEAARRNIQREGLSEISKGIQANTLMSNQRRDDMYKAAIFAKYNTAMTKEDRANLDDMLQQWSGNGSSVVNKIGGLFKKNPSSKTPKLKQGR